MATQNTVSQEVFFSMRARLQKTNPAVNFIAPPCLTTIKTILNSVLLSDSFLLIVIINLAIF